MASGDNYGGLYLENGSTTAAKRNKDRRRWGMASLKTQGNGNVKLVAFIGGTWSAAQLLAITHSY